MHVFRENSKLFCVVFAQISIAVRLLTTDPSAIHHVLSNISTYQRPEPSRYMMSRTMGDGLLTVEGDRHKYQVRIQMNYLFCLIFD
jgi:hypothetical protein